MQPAHHRHFRRHDPILHTVGRRIGPCRLKPSRDRFGMLVRSIISQQISVGAARSIRGKLESLVGKGGIKPASLLALSADELRAVGLSRQKGSYLLDLSRKVQDGTVRLARIGRLSDDEIIDELCQINGIGRWTAQMFLIFALGREDVFPSDDFGVRLAITRLYGYDDVPSREQLAVIGERWSPFASVGAWYCWRYLDLLRDEKNAAAIVS